MRGGVVITHPSGLGDPGGGTVGCIRIANQMKRLGADVRVLAVSRGSVVPIEEVEVPVESTRPSRLHYLLDGRPLAARLQVVVRESNCRSVVGWTHEMAFAVPALRRMGVGIAMIAAFPGYGQWRRRATSLPRIRWAIDEFFRFGPLRNADLVFALSEFTKRELIDILEVRPEKVVRVYWGVEDAFFEIPRKQPSKISNVIFFGAFTPQKGVLDAIRALGLLRRGSNTDWSLRIAGWGDQGPVLDLARSEQIEENVAFLGRLDHLRLAEQLEWAHVGLLPSHVESFGLSIAEAQAAALPVVAFRAGSVPEVVVDGRTGFLAELGDVEGLCGALATLMASPSRSYAMGLEARQRMARMFRWESTAREMLNAMDRLGR